MDRDTDMDKLLAFVAGLTSYEQAKNLVGNLDYWTAEQYNRFGKLLGMSRNLTEKGA